MSIHPKVSVLDLEWVTNQTPVDSAEVDLIEIGLVNLDYLPQVGWKEVEHYTTLIERRRELPKRVADLTGIPQAELRAAPAFYQIYELIELLTRGRTIVGHAVALDYRHLKNEMLKHMSSYERETFCTLENARYQWPEFKSYELSSLCHLYGLRKIQSHRALNDALNCAEIFKKLAPTPTLPKTTTHEHCFELFELKEHYPWLSKSSYKELQNLGPAPATYSFYSHKKLLWAGFTSSAKSELPSQLKALAHEFQERSQPVTKIKVLHEENEVSACLKVEKIKARFRPTWQRHRPNIYGIFEYRDRQGLTRLKVRRAQKNRKQGLYYDLSKKKAQARAKLWETQLTSFHKLISTDIKEQELWMQKINTKRRQQLKSLSQNKPFSIKMKTTKDKRTFYINPFKNIFSIENGKVYETKLDLAGHCAVLQSVQQIKGRHQHPYLFKEFERPFTLKDLQHSVGQNASLAVLPRP